MAVTAKGVDLAATVGIGLVTRMKHASLPVMNLLLCAAITRVCGSSRGSGPDSDGGHGQGH